MMFHSGRTRRWMSLGLCLLTASTSLAQPATTEPTFDELKGPVYRALSDSAALESDEQIRESLDLMKNGLGLHAERRQFDDAAQVGAGAQPAKLPPEVLAQMKEGFDRAIEGLEKELQKLPEKEVETRQQMTEAIKTMRQQRAEMLGEAPPAAPAQNAQQEAKTLKRPPKRQGELTPEQAVADLKTVLADNAPPAGVAAFRASPDYSSAPRAAKAAAAALLQKRPMAALAGLLRAQELAPGEPGHLVNLAGLADKLEMPRHALALLAAAEKLNQPIATGAGMDGKSVLLVNRGHALITIGRYAEAEAALRQAAEIDPTFGEARANLALALWLQDDPKKKEDAVRFARASRKRATVTKLEEAVAPAPPSKDEAFPDAGQKLTAERLAAIATRQRGGRPPASSVFSLHRGKSGSLPTIKIPRKIIDGKELHPKVKALAEELRAKIDAVGTKMNALEDAMRKRERSGGVSPISAARARDIFWYIGNAEYDPTLQALYLDQWRAANDIGVGTFGGQLHNPFASHELEKAQDAIWAASMDKDQRDKAMHAAAEPYHGSWQGPIRNYETSINRYFRQCYRFQTALAANLSDPMYHEYASLLIELQAHSLASLFVGTLETVTRYDEHFISLFGTNGETGEKPEDAKPGDLPAADACGAHLRGEYTAAVSVGFVEVSGNCEKVAVELSAGEWVKAFGEVEYTFESGEISIFLGGSGEVPLPGTIVKTGAKAGCYITINDKGEFVDAGFKTTQSSGVEIDVIVGSVAYEREIETPYSIVAAFTFD